MTKKLGLGSIYKAPFYSSDFSEIGIERDLFITDKELQTKAYAKQIAFTHRKLAQKDIYFISNQQNKERRLELSFAVSGKIPGIYNPVNDRKNYLRLKARSQSIFILNFRRAYRGNKVQHG